MTPQEIADLHASVRERISKAVRVRMAQEDEAIKSESLRVQGLCFEHIGHVYGPGSSMNSILFGDSRYCVLCGAQEPKRPA